MGCHGASKITEINLPTIFFKQPVWNKNGNQDILSNCFFVSSLNMISKALAQIKTISKVISALYCQIIANFVQNNKFMPIKTQNCQYTLYSTKLEIKTYNLNDFLP